MRKDLERITELEINDDIRFVLKGEHGAVQFCINMKWGGRPTGFDVGYHSYKPMYSEQTAMGNCCYLDGKPCYYDGSSLRAEDWVDDVLIKKGAAGIWAKLEEEYAHLFESED